MEFENKIKSVTFVNDNYDIYGIVKYIASCYVDRFYLLTIL